jgi:MOSC domain-containing protein YiiM
LAVRIACLVVANANSADAENRNKLQNGTNAMTYPALSGHVASLHLHPVEPGTPLQCVEAIELIESKGILGEPRYFGRLSRDNGSPNRRQVTLIEREQIAEHAGALGRDSIAPGAVRANIETTGINLISLIGHEVEIGEAVLFLYAPRDPCAKMDVVCQGLRQRMMDNRQGVLAEVRRSGKVRIGDAIRAVNLDRAAAAAPGP